MSEARQRDNVTPFPEVAGFSRTSGLGGQVQVDIGDLAVEVRPDGQGGNIIAVTAPAVHSHRDDENDDFDANLADEDYLAEADMVAIADEVWQGVEADDQSRAPLIRDYTEGLDLLGTAMQQVSTATQGQKRNISNIGHPLLIEAIVKYWAGAQAELLPAAGPAKVATTGQVSSEEEDAAKDFADILNYYLTETATEFYPDTAQMLIHQAYCGNAFKKVYYCPMRRRPVSEAVRMSDLIVSEEASDLDTALRVTHQSFPSRAQVRRMQILGKYRDFKLTPGMLALSASALAIKRTEGLSGSSLRPQDIPLNLLECDITLDPEYCALNGKYERAAPEGLPLPYKVTIDRNTKQVFEIRRNWEDGDELYLKDNMYVRYGLVPGMGFHHWGFLQLLGNQTKTMRAIWRLLIDSGMFGIFPGGVKIKSARTSTNEINPGPGEWVDIDVPGGTDITKMLMPLPYKALDAVFVQFAQMIQDSAAKLGGTVELEVGEGRTNMPVGTVLSMVEQQTQIMGAVHKNNHRSQKEELMKLRKVFAKNPQDLWRLNPDPQRRYETAAEFMDLNLLPASDPNVPSMVTRISRIAALLTIVQQTPGLWDLQEVLRRALAVLQVSDPQTLLLTPEQLAAQNQGPPPPPPDPAKMAMANARVQQTQMQHEGKMAELQQQAQDSQRDLQTKSQAAALESADRQADRMAHLQEASIKAGVEREKIALQGQQAERQAQLDHAVASHEAGLKAQESANQMAIANVKATQPPTAPAPDAGGTSVNMPQ